MPYIKQEARKKFEFRFESDVADNAGELNYALTQLVSTYFQINGGRYQQINDVLGALEGCKMEFYRRVVAPYEDKKKMANGDVY